MGTIKDKMEYITKKVYPDLDYKEGSGLIRKRLRNLLNGAGIKKGGTLQGSVTLDRGTVLGAFGEIGARDLNTQSFLFSLLSYQGALRGFNVMEYGTTSISFSGPF